MKNLCVVVDVLAHRGEGVDDDAADHRRHDEVDQDVVRQRERQRLERHGAPCLPVRHVPDRRVQEAVAHERLEARAEARAVHVVLEAELIAEVRRVVRDGGVDVQQEHGEQHRQAKQSAALEKNHRR